MMRPWLAFLAGCGLVAVLAVGACLHHRTPAVIEDYVAVRSEVLRLAASVAEPGTLLLLGDSISEQQARIDLCGAPVFNAAISGGTLRDVAKLAPDLADALHPSRILIAIGTNDAEPVSLRPVADWEHDYRALLARLRGYPILLVALPAIEPGKSGSGDYDVARIAEFNAALRRIAADLKLPLTDPIAMETVDGVHPSRRGAAQWRAAVARRC